MEQILLENGDERRIYAQNVGDRHIAIYETIEGETESVTLSYDELKLVNYLMSDVSLYEQKTTKKEQA